MGAGGGGVLIKVVALPVRGVLLLLRLFLAEKRGSECSFLKSTPVEDSLKILHLICPVSFRPRGCFAESADCNEIVQVVVALA